MMFNMFKCMVLSLSDLQDIELCDWKMSLNGLCVQNPFGYLHGNLKKKKKIWICSKMDLAHYWYQQLPKSHPAFPSSNVIYSDFR